MSSFDLNALSGINAASNGLSVISNNLANSQTVGFKASRAEFADMFSGPQSSPGNGVRVAAYTQDFSQGTIQGTGRELDYAIDGEGFFILDDQTGKYPAIYTRNGSFKLDKDGYITDQSGNQLQGYLRNDTLSTDTSPVFDTTLSSIDLDALNRTPRATDEMTFAINLDGEEDNNVDANGDGLAFPAAAPTPVRDNLLRLIDFEDGADASNDPYSGFPDFSTNKIIHDSLGGEHRLTANFYKRDVVSVANSTDDYNGDGTNDKYSSWIVQYTVQDYDETTESWVTSGHVADANGNLIDNTGAIVTTPAPAGTDRVEGQLFELRFDTDGNLVDVLSPNSVVAPVGVSATNSPLPAASWTSSGSTGTLNWVIDTPFSGANDPLGNTQSTPINIDVDFNEMSQFAGSYNLDGVTQNGFKIGDLVGLTTSLDGVIEARYSNGRSLAVARIGIADFNDRNALEKLGSQMYAESYNSGTVQLGTPQSSGFGSITEGSLEYSNVDVTSELVNMIQTQRTYQASAQVISTSQTLTQTILNL